MQNALELRGLTKRRGDWTLDGVSFSLPSGCIMGLIGSLFFPGSISSHTTKLLPLPVIIEEKGEDAIPLPCMLSSNVLGLMAITFMFLSKA